MFEDKLGILFNFSQKLGKLAEAVSDHFIFKALGFVLVFFIVFKYSSKIFKELMSMDDLLNYLNIDSFEEIDEKVKESLKKLEDNLDNNSLFNIKKKMK